MYRITNLIDNCHYYGVRTSNIEPKKDLGIRYFSSSSNKNFINLQKLNSLNFRYKIIKIFDNRAQAVELEIKLHRYFNVALNENFYNKSNQTTTKFNFSHSVGTKRPEHSVKMKGKNNPFYGKKHTDETKAKISKKYDKIKMSKKISQSKLKIMEDGRTLQEQITEKRMETMTKIGENGETIYKKAGLKSGETRKERGSQAGCRNPKAKRIIIKDCFGNIICETYGNFIETCKKNEYPVNAFRGSLLKGTKVFSRTRKSDITQLINFYGEFCYMKYKDWTVTYAP